jgi:small conductance mechanosensitive channel
MPPLDTDQLTRFAQSSALPLLVTAIVALVAFRVARPIIHRALVRIVERRASDEEGDQLGVEEARKRVETVETLIARVLKLAVAGLFVLVVLTVFDLLPVLAGLSIVLAALTVAGQDVIRDYIMGVLIILEAQYFKGDWVQVGGVEGTVEEVGLRRTVLRDATGTVHSVSNGDIRVASNLTRFYARIVVDVTVAFGADLDRVTSVIDEVGLAMADDPEWGPRLLEAPGLIRVGAFTEVGVPLRVGGRVRAADRFTATGELRRRLLIAFQREGIQLPGVQRFVPFAPTAGPGGTRGGGSGSGGPASGPAPGPETVPDDLPPIG